jgi:RNA polymerase sigma factor (sigma-70 family)
MITRRQSILEMFSSFIQFNDTRSGTWITDPRLRRSMQKCLAESAGDEALEGFWVIYWHRRWAQTAAPLAKGHLYAYLQEPAYWAAEQILRKMIGTEQLTDCFQIANTGMTVVLKRFDSGKGFKFKSFAGVVFLNLLREELRKKNEAAGCTTWGLLRKVTKTKLRESLERENLSAVQVKQFLLAWKCFRELYVPSQVGRTDRLPEPDAELWEKIPALYNQERIAAGVVGEAATGKGVQQWMLKIEAIVRRYLSPRVDSLDPFPGGEDGSTIDVPDAELNPLDRQIALEMAQEYQDLLTQQDEILATALNQLDAEMQEIVQLYYGHKLKQQAIAKQMGILQPKVARRLEKARGLLLAALLDWRRKLRESQGEVNKDLTPDQVKDASLALEGWLENRYPPNNLNAALQE